MGGGGGVVARGCRAGDWDSEMGWRGTLAGVRGLAEWRVVVGVPGRVCSAGPVGGGGRSGGAISPTGWWAVHTERGGWMRIVEWVGGVAEGWRQEAYEDRWQAVRVVGGGGWVGGEVWVGGMSGRAGGPPAISSTAQAATGRVIPQQGGGDMRGRDGLAGE